jgi:hypothetical protein
MRTNQTLIQISIGVKVLKLVKVLSPLQLPRKQRQPSHIVLAPGFAALSPLRLPRRQRQPCYIVLAICSGFVNSERVSTFVVESQEIQADHKNGKENIP